MFTAQMFTAQMGSAWMFTGQAPGGSGTISGQTHPFYPIGKVCAFYC